ncbi:hypothetical protein [Streptomyces sp. BH105]|uniref:hypothetical protein n=1 Tax=Streptomyces sp. BH105 TaxID=3410408 RepID=UPI003CF9A732
MSMQEFGYRVPESVAEILDDVIAGEALERAIEDGHVVCRLHLPTGRVMYALAPKAAPVA